MLFIRFNNREYFMSHKILLLQNSISVKYVKNDLEIKGNLFKIIKNK